MPIIRNLARTNPLGAQALPSTNSLAGQTRLANPHGSLLPMSRPMPHAGAPSNMAALLRPPRTAMTPMLAPVPQRVHLGHNPAVASLEAKASLQGPPVPPKIPLSNPMFAKASSGGAHTGRASFAPPQGNGFASMPDPRNFQRPTIGHVSVHQPAVSMPAFPNRQASMHATIEQMPPRFQPRPMQAQGAPQRPPVPQHFMQHQFRNPFLTVADHLNMQEALENVRPLPNGQPNLQAMHNIVASYENRLPDKKPSFGEALRNFFRSEPNHRPSGREGNYGGGSSHTVKHDTRWDHD